MHGGYEQGDEPRALDAGERWMMRRVSTFTGVAVGFALLSLALWWLSARAEAQRGALLERTAWCKAERVAKRVLADGPRADRRARGGKLPPVDTVSARPEDVLQVFEVGVEVDELLHARVDEVRDDGTLAVELQGRAVLPRGGVTIVNLWATFCEPCKAEMPRFRELLADRERVHFVAVHVQDNTEPRSAYQAIEPLLPPVTRRLVDRSPDSVELIAPLKHHKLFRGDLPVTLVLGCQRRVRWVRFGAIAPAEFVGLGETVDSLVAELDSPRCQQARRPAPGESAAPRGDEVELAVTRCGDGRCDLGELDRCPEDCEGCGDGVCQPELGERARTCPQDCRRAPTPARVSACGDGRCEPAAGEDCRSCTSDCGCSDLETCQELGGGQWKCAVELIE